MACTVIWALVGPLLKLEIGVTGQCLGTQGVCLPSTHSCTSECPWGTSVHSRVCTRRKPTCPQLCLHALSQRPWKQKANSQWNQQWEWRRAARLQLIMRLAADVLVKPSPLHPGSYHGDGVSNCGARRAPLPRWTRALHPHRLCLTPCGSWGIRVGRGGHAETGSCDYFFFFLFPFFHFFFLLADAGRAALSLGNMELRNKWAGVSPKWEPAAIGCCRPAVPMGARPAVGTRNISKATRSPGGAGTGEQRCAKGGGPSSHMATPRTDLIREPHRRPSAARAHCAFHRKQH